MAAHHTVMPPTRGILAAASLLEEGVGRFLKARDTLPKLGKYESPLEALNLFYLVLRHVEALCSLAKRDLVMLVPACVLSRAALETTIKMRWMLHPSTIFECEARWLVHLSTEEDYHERMAVQFEEADEHATARRAVAKQLREFRVSIEAMLPAGVKLLKAMPKVPAMLKEIDAKEFYRSYIHLCQFVHGTHAGTGLYRKNLGCGKALGEFISPELWKLPLFCAAKCLCPGGKFLLGKLGGKVEAFVAGDFERELNDSINRI
jgi:hypothetical protein